MRANLQPWSVPHDASAGVYRAVQKLAGTVLPRGNRVELLVIGQATFDDEGVYMLYDGVGRKGLPPQLRGHLRHRGP